jgi:hypothetical protein
MTVSPRTETTPYFGKATVATSSPQGTVLPRSGVFWGVHAPQYHSAVVIGEFPTSWADETQVRVWREPYEHLAEQTNFQADRLRLANFEIDLDRTSTGIFGDPTSSQFTTGSYPQATVYHFIRDADVACAFVAKWEESTESPWRKLRDALAPLRAASSAVLEAIRTELEPDKANPDQPQHTGLAAVGWLTKVLGLSRPTILRMGGVPESTFYAWQKHPQSLVRTPSISRLLRLQAQAGLLAEALGLDGMKAWMLSRDRLERLQGDDATFTQTLAETEEALTAATQIAQRPRMRLGDYELDAEQPADNPTRESTNWPGASRLPEEPAE